MIAASAKIAGMAKKKSSSGEHKTPRVPYQIPQTWSDLARRMAAKQKQPTLWFLLSLIADEAVRQGEEVPPLPWEQNLPTDEKA